MRGWLYICPFQSGPWMAAEAGLLHVSLVKNMQ